MTLTLIFIFIVGCLLCKAETRAGAAENKTEALDHPSFGHHYQRDVIFHGMFGP